MLIQMQKANTLVNSVCGRTNSSRESVGVSFLPFVWFIVLTILQTSQLEFHLSKSVSWVKLTNDFVDDDLDKVQLFTKL